MNRPRLMWLAACTAVLNLHAQRAEAGIADTPLPRFADGTPSVRVAAVPGIVKRMRLQTDFLCTSLDSRPVHIGVQIFGPDGVLLNDVGAGVGAILNVTPGQTVTIGTGATAAYLESAVIPLAAVSQGSARVVASSERVRCNVMVLDDATTPPTAVARLGEGVQPAVGSPLNAPLPTFASGRQGTHAALIPGIVKRGRVQTDFFCTSLASEAIDLGVEIFAPDGTLENRIADGNGAVLNVQPGATVTLGTTGTAAFLETTVITTRGVAQGFARVVSTSGEVTCSAAVLDSAITPPTSMSGLSGDPGVLGDVNRDGIVSAADLPALVARTFR